MLWRLPHSEFVFTVQYKKGCRNNHADALARLKNLGETQYEIDDGIPCLFSEE